MTILFRLHPATADGLGIMYPDDAYGWFTRVSRERAPAWRNEVRIGALAEPFNPVDFLVKTKSRYVALLRPMTGSRRLKKE